MRTSGIVSVLKMSYCEKFLCLEFLGTTCLCLVTFFIDPSLFRPPFPTTVKPFPS